MARDDSLDVTLPTPWRAPHASGIRGHRLALAADDVIEREGLRMTLPVRTWLDLASTLAVGPLVAAGDYIIHWRAPLATRDDLAALMSRSAGRRGIRRARQALDLLSGRAESPPESELRVIVALAGLPAPAVNHVFVPDSTGGRVRTDLEFIEWGLILEYMGDWHRTQEQWRKDMTRRSRIEVATGKAFIELNADDLKDELELVSSTLR